MSDDERRRAYEAEDGTVFDTTYRGRDVYLADDGTVVAKPEAGDETAGDSEEGDSDAD